MKKLTLAGLILALASAPLSAATGPEFVGKWVHVTASSVRAEVKPNGGTYIFTTYSGGVAKKYVAVAEGGVLQIGGGPREVKADIEVQSGHLIVGGQEYRRLRKGEAFEYVEKPIPRF